MTKHISATRYFFHLFTSFLSQTRARVKSTFFSLKSITEFFQLAIVHIVSIWTVPTKSAAVSIEPTRVYTKLHYRFSCVLHHLYSRGSSFDIHFKHTQFLLFRTIIYFFESKKIFYSKNKFDKKTEWWNRIEKYYANRNDEYENVDGEWFWQLQAFVTNGANFIANWFKFWI